MEALEERSHPCPPPGFTGTCPLRGPLSFLSVALAIALETVLGDVVPPGRNLVPGAPPRGPGGPCRCRSGSATRRSSPGGSTSLLVAGPTPSWTRALASSQGPAPARAPARGSRRPGTPPGGAMEGQDGKEGKDAGGATGAHGEEDRREAPWTTATATRRPFRDHPGTKALSRHVGRPPRPAAAACGANGRRLRREQGPVVGTDPWFLLMVGGAWRAFRRVGRRRALLRRHALRAGDAHRRPSGAAGPERGPGSAHEIVIALPQPAQPR